MRQAVTLKGRTARGLEERTYLRLPGVTAAATRMLWRLPRRSRIRQAYLRRFTQMAFDATNRGDFEVGFLPYHPDIELITPPSMVGLGFDPLYRGREARFEFQRRWTAEWGEMRFEPNDLFDLGDRLLFLGRIRGSGLSSGAGFESEWGNVITVSEGQVIREQPFFDREEALRAAGLSE